MNILCIFLCFYFFTISVVEWVKSRENFGNIQNFYHKNQTESQKLDYSYSNRIYPREKLLDIGKYVSNNRSSFKIDPSVAHTINELNIAQHRKRRGKRGGQKKVIDHPRGVDYSNLIHPKITNTLKRHDEKIKCMTLNCHSVVTKDVIVGQYLREEKIDFAILTETWYSDDKQHHIDTSDLNQSGYTLSLVNRPKRIGGGVGLVSRTGVNVRKINSRTRNSFEHGIWKVVLRNISMTIVGVYRPPNLCTVTNFVSEFCEFLEDVIPQNSNLMLMGDFNLHLNDGTHATSEFKNCLFSLGLHQHVDFSTHIGGNVLDLVITEQENGVKIKSCEQGPFLSDHCVVKIVTEIKKENIKSETVSFRNYKNIDKDAFSEDLKSLEIEQIDINEYVCDFENKIQVILDKHAPVTEKTRITRAPKPWFSDSILEKKQSFRKAEKTWKRYKKPEDYHSFQNARNKYFMEIKKVKKQTFSEKVSEFKGDSKKLYKFVTEITGSKVQNPMPSGESDNAIADSFADHFMNKISKIRESLKTYPNYEPSVKNVENLPKFDELSEDDVKKIINNMQSKSCELDVLPTVVLKMFLTELLPLITKLVNLSLSQGIFPEKWKQAVVRPLLKKVGLDLIYSNYRPVSNLPFLSKVIEKAALLVLNSHAEKHKLLPTNQSAYRKNHSCESALLRLVNDLLGAMEKQEVTALIAIDLSAAFDTVDHSILIDVLNKQYGLTSTALSWVDSYLHPRSCRVNVNSAYSTSRALECSVPQGSCLGPWLYLAYAGTLFDDIPPTVTLRGFADDHTMDKSFSPNIQNSEKNTISDLENAGETTNNWMNSNKLKMNTSKTEFIMFGSKQQLTKCETKSIKIVNDTINKENCIRYLGAFLDENLNFKEHVKRKCRTAMINFMRIKNIRQYLTKEATETLVLSLVMSHLDYCNSILYGIANCDLQKMQRIQNMCAKLVLSRSKYDSSKQALFDLHWLPVKARISFKILTYMFNCSKGNAPDYLTELLESKSAKRVLRSSECVDNCYNVPFNKRKSFADRSFSYIGPKLYNQLPTEIRNSNTIEAFKRNLKTHMFRDYFNLF